MLPDPEVLVVAFLRTHADVTTVVGTRVATRTPSNLDEPWVRVFLIDDTPAQRSRALHVTTAYVQFDCYGSADRDLAQAEASEISRTIEAALVEMPTATHAGAVVTSAKPGSRRRAPDTDLEPARERYVLDAAITLHPA